jgi:hypothetical protein
MKRIATLIVVGIIAASAVSAQAWGPAGSVGPGPSFTQNAEVVKVEGKLTLVNGMIALKDKDKTYYVGGLNRLVGFIDGLKENASVKLEGYAIAVPAAPEYAHLRVTKLTFNGKDYDLSNTFGRGMMGGRGDGNFGRGGRRDGNYGRGGMMGGGFGRW